VTQRSSAGRNVAANLVANLWVAALTVLALPIYLRAVGAEAFGLIGVFTVLQAFTTLLDLGLGATLTREAARLASSGAEGRRELRDLVRTLEIVYWGVAVAIVLVVALLAVPIARYWLNPETLTREALVGALVLIGCALGARWPTGLYTGALLGVERQVTLNLMRTVVETVRIMGAIAVLQWVRPTIEAFFVWQALVSVVGSVIAATLVWRAVPGDAPAHWRGDVLRRVLRTTVGMGGIAVTALVLTQMDKLVLSRFLSLEAFGYYTFASSVAFSLGLLAAPVFNAYYPRFTRIVHANDPATLRDAYHAAAQSVAVLVVPTGLVLAIFAREILAVWTRDPATTAAAAPILTILALGSIANGLMNVPYALQLAHGWTSLAVRTNAVAILVLAPALAFLAVRADAVGASFAWLALNVGYVAIQAPLAHRRLLPGEHGRWVRGDVLAPLLAAAAPALALRLALPAPGPAATVAVVIVAWLAATLGAVLATPRIRGRLAAMLAARRAPDR
jgi:O-antigen/teichoic acid export membrane protein